MRVEANRASPAPSGSQKEPTTLTRQTKHGYEHKRNHPASDTANCAGLFRDRARLGRRSAPGPLPSFAASLCHADRQTTTNSPFSTDPGEHLSHIDPTPRVRPSGRAPFLTLNETGGPVFAGRQFLFPGRSWSVLSPRFLRLGTVRTMAAQCPWVGPRKSFENSP